MPTWLRDAILCWSFILGCIMITLFLWYYLPVQSKNSHAEGKELMNNGTNYWKNQTNKLRKMKRSADDLYEVTQFTPSNARRMKYPCNTFREENKIDDLYVCYNSSAFDSTVAIPLTIFSIGGFPTRDWKNYE